MLGRALQPDLEELILNHQWNDLRAVAHEFEPADLAEIIADLPHADQAILFRVLPRPMASATFSHLPPDDQEDLIRSLSSEHMREILEQMSPDDRTHLFEELPAAVTRRLLEYLSPEELKSARELLGYAPETAGRYMTPRYVSIRPEWTANRALEHLRQTRTNMETLSFLYVVDQEGKLQKDLRLASLVLADPGMPVFEVDDRPLVAVQASTDREDVLLTFKKYDRFALPVVDHEAHMLGIITADDMLDVSTMEATEDIQKIGGQEALGDPYLEVAYTEMVKKRAGWLSILFVGELLTASAMSHFEDEIAHTVVLAMFVPLIISSGGNCGSQAATLIVRALALQELRLRDALRVFLRELASGVTLGTWLGLLGFARVALWHQLGITDYGTHHLQIAATVCISLIGVVAFGTLAGSMLPFLLRSLGFDPATSSTPFVATLVDVTGLVIYFGVAASMLQGSFP